MKSLAIIVAMALALGAVSCAPTRAVMEQSAYESILWPGPPEKPMVKFLWSLKRISGGAGTSRFMSFVSGGFEHDVSDPRFADVLVSPQGVFVDKGERLYIADAGASRVTVIDMGSMESFNIHDAGMYRLVSPIGVVVAPNGNIYVSDADLRKVVYYDGRGKFIGFFEGDLMRPTGLAIDPEGQAIYVSDTWGHRLYKYDMDGRMLLAISQRGDTPGSLNYPTYITVGRDGVIYVSDTLNFRIQSFAPNGEFLGAFGLAGDDYNAFDKTKGIAVDSEGHIYVVDSAQDMVKIYDKDGRLLLFFGKKGTREGMFSLPTGIFIDHRDRIYVTENLNMRLQVFQFLGGR